MNSIYGSGENSSRDQLKLEWPQLRFFTKFCDQTKDGVQLKELKDVLCRSMSSFKESRSARDDPAASDQKVLN